MNLDEVSTLLLASRIAPEQIKAALSEAVSSNNLPAPPWGREQVLSLLDVLAEGGGALSISARFAKARFLLRR